jgi:hypothetical protein
MDHRVKPGDESLCMEASIHPSRRVRSLSSIDFRSRHACAVPATFENDLRNLTQASDSMLTTASIERKWISNWSIAATFEGEFSNITSSYAGKGVVRYTW